MPAQASPSNMVASKGHSTRLITGMLSLNDKNGIK
jgi:hypothetical protein